MFTNNIFKIILFFFLWINTSVLCSQSLTNEEEAKIKKYAESLTIEEGVGQLFMVNLPGDVYNYKKNPYFDTLMNLSIGNFIVNTYNLKTKEQTSNTKITRNIIDYLRNYQSIAKDSKRIPLLFAANFENKEVTAISQGVIFPLSPLAVASSNDSNLIRLNGKLVGASIK